MALPGEVATHQPGPQLSPDEDTTYRERTDGAVGAAEAPLRELPQELSVSGGAQAWGRASTPSTPGAQEQETLCGGGRAEKWTSEHKEIGNLMQSVAVTTG